MKKLALPFFILLAVMLGLIGGPSLGGVSCSVPFNLQNNTVADATQVMANYNAIITCLANSTAKSGVNSDITALSGLTTPLIPSQGGTTVFVGGTSGGSANAQIISATIPNNFSLTAGNQVTFIAGFTNTGPTTLNVNGTGTLNFFRRTQLGVSAMVGGEIIVGHSVTALYDGTRFQITSIPPAQVGEIKDWGGPTPPLGYFFLGGFCVSQTTFADLFAVIGTTYDPGGACSAGLFQIPDGRGRVMAGQDNMGSTDDTGTPANRLTVAGSGCNGTVRGGAGCGLQNSTIGQVNLPNVAWPDTLSVTNGSLTVSDTIGISDTLTVNNGSLSVASSSTGITVNAITGLLGGGALGFAAGSNQATGLGFSDPQHIHNLSGTIARAGSITKTGSASLTGSVSKTGTVTSGGSGTPLATIPPLLVVNKIIKY